MNIEIMRNTLYKAYLDDFAQFTSKLGGATSEVMGDLLSFEVLTSATSLLDPRIHFLSCNGRAIYRLVMKSR